MGTQGFDIGEQKIDAKEVESQGVWVELTGGDEEPLMYTPPGDDQTPKPVRILVAGTYSSQYTRARDIQQQKMIAKRRTKLTPAQIKENGRDLAAACCIAWEGFYFKGTPFPCSAPNALILFEKAPFILEQVESQMTDHASFFKTASSS
jgi:hypothetical protein